MKGKIRILGGILVIAVIGLILISTGMFSPREDDPWKTTSEPPLTTALKESHTTITTTEVPWTTEKAYGDGEILVFFEVKVPEWTPKEDRIFIRFDWYYHEGQGGVPMGKKEPNVWTVAFLAPSNYPLTYIYNRNNFGFATDEEFTPDSDEARREQYIGTESIVIQDEVMKWRWLRKEPPSADISAFIPETLPEREEPFIIGIALLDYYQQGFHEFVSSTFDRLREKGFTYVGIVYSPVFIIQHDPLTFTHDPLNTMTLDELDFIITEARNRNLKIMLATGLETGFEYFEEIEAAFLQNQSIEWYIRFVEEWEDAMVSTAQLAEQYQIEIYTPSNQWPFWTAGTTKEQKPVINSAINAALQQIRSVYSGKISSDYYREDDFFNYYKELDWIGDKWWWPIANEKETSLEEMKIQAKQLIADVYTPIYNKYQKPIFLQQLAYASYDGAAGAEQISTEGPEVAEWFPYNPEWPTDFQEQADAFEAVLQAIYDDSRFVGVFNFGYGYWDSCDKAPGIRSKPAEDVWVKWNAVFIGEELPLVVFDVKVSSESTYKNEQYLLVVIQVQIKVDITKFM